MASPSFSGVFTADDRLFVRARIVLCAVLIALIPLLLAFNVRFPNGKTEVLLYVVLLVPICVTTALQCRELNVRGRINPDHLMWALVPDILAFAGLAYLFSDYGDAGYPIMVLVPMGYALIVVRRQAMIAAVLASAAYVISQFFAVRFEVIDMALLVVKAATIPLFTAFVATAVNKRDRRGAVTARAAAENQAISEQLQQNLNELQAVSNITEIVHSSLDLEQVSSDVLDVLARVIGIDTCSLLVIDKESAETLFSASLGDVAAPDVASDATVSLPEDSLFTCVSVFENARAMVLFCAAAGEVESLGEQDRMMLATVASELVVGVENSRLYRLTRHMAITDELTGLYNYRYLQQRLDEEIERARRYGSSLSLLMIDADDFKGYNDSYGHVAGDAALSELASVLAASVREIDIVVRYGGEEFSIVLPETDAAGAFVVAEKVRESVRMHHFANEHGERCCSLTVSIGLATFPAHAGDKDLLLRASDDALYRAKNGGRNRVRTPVTGTAAQPGREDASEEVADEWTGD